MNVLRKIMLPIFLAAAIAMSAGTALASQEIVVSAAASLTNAFTQIGKDFEGANPGVKVIFNFAASGPLLQQIVQGAPVDVFASADLETMDEARQKGAVDASTVFDFAGTKLVLVAPKGSPLKGLKDLSGGFVRRIAVGKPETVPAGRYTEEALEKDGMWGGLEPKFIYAASVRQVLDYVARGEVDAGFVYETDAAIMPDKLKLVCEVGGHKRVVYPIAAVTSSKNPVLARKFMEYVLGSKGQAVLAGYGFSKP